MLALVGSGEYLPDVELMDQALMRRLAEPARVVCLPTAAGLEGEAMVNSWMQRGVDHFTRLGAEVTAVPVIDNATAHTPEYAETIYDANFVYMSGGNPGHLYDSLAGTMVWDAILDVHQRGGVVAGCSAGAMIMGERIVGPGADRKGFNLLEGTVIMPHFDEFTGFIGRVTRFLGDKSLTMVGIDGRTALVVENGRYSVIGRSEVTIFTKGEKQKFSEGSIPAGLFAVNTE